MLYYYSKNGQTVGPMTRQDLDARVADGTITPKSHVFKKGYSAWVRYSELVKNEQPAAQPAPVQATPVQAAPVQPVSVPVTQIQTAQQPVAQVYPAYTKTNKGSFLSYNKWIDDLFIRIFKLPNWVARDEKALHDKISDIPSLTAFVSWVSLVLCSLGTLEVKFILIALFGGVLYQYAVYLVCCMLSSLLKGPRVVVSSMVGPRLLGFLALVGAFTSLYYAGYYVYHEVYAFLTTYLASAFSGFVLMYVCFNADKLIVTVKPEERNNTGRDFNNLLKFILRSSATVQHLLMPIIMLASSISFIIVQVQITRIKDKLEGLGMMSGLYDVRSQIQQLDSVGEYALYCTVGAPIIFWLAYCIISYLLDLLDGIFSLGVRTEKEKAQD